MPGFGDVLRGFGSVLNPAVAQELAQEDQRKQAIQGQVGMTLLQNELQKQSPEYQMRMEALNNEKGYREALSALGPNPDLETVAGIATKFGKPELAAQMFKAQEDRAARMLQAQQMLDMKGQQLELQRADMERKATSDADKRRIDEWFKTQQLEGQRQSREINAQLRMMGFEVQRQGQQIQLAKLDQAKAAQVDKSAQQLGTALEKAGLPEIDAVLGRVEDTLDNNPKVAEYISGPLSGIPDMAVPREVAAARQDFRKLFNITLKNRSGAAVTNQELERLKDEFGSGLLKTPKQLADAVTTARNIINNHYASVASGFGKDALDHYNDNIRQFGGRVVLGGDGSPAKPAATGLGAWTVKEKP